MADAKELSLESVSVRCALLEDVVAILARLPTGLDVIPDKNWVFVFVNSRAIIFSFSISSAVVSFTHFQLDLFQSLSMSCGFSVKIFIT